MGRLTRHFQTNPWILFGDFPDVWHVWLVSDIWRSSIQCFKPRIVKILKSGHCSCWLSLLVIFSDFKPWTSMALGPKCWCHWIGLREHLQETMVFTCFYHQIWGFPVKFPIIQFYDGEIWRSSLRYVFKPTLAEGKNSIISRTMGSKLVKMVYKAHWVLFGRPWAQFDTLGLQISTPIASRKLFLSGDLTVSSGKSPLFIGKTHRIMYPPCSGCSI